MNGRRDVVKNFETGGVLQIEIQIARVRVSYYRMTAASKNAARPNRFVLSSNDSVCQFLAENIDTVLMKSLKSKIGYASIAVGVICLCNFSS